MGNIYLIKETTRKRKGWKLVIQKYYYSYNYNEMCF